MGPVLIAAGLCLPFIVRLLVAATPTAPTTPDGTDLWPRVTPSSSEPGELLASAVCILPNVRLTSVLAMDEELLVGFWGCGGNWFAPDDPRADRLGIVRDPGWLEGNLAFSIPWPFARRRAAETFARWQVQGTPVAAFVSVQHELVGLVDLSTGTVFASELPPEWMGRNPKAGAELAR